MAACVHINILRYSLFLKIEVKKVSNITILKNDCYSKRINILTEHQFATSNLMACLSECQYCFILQIILQVSSPGFTLWAHSLVCMRLSTADMFYRRVQKGSTGYWMSKYQGLCFMVCAPLSSSKRMIREISAMSHLDVRNDLRQVSPNVLAVLTKKKTNKKTNQRNTVVISSICSTIKNGILYCQNIHMASSSLRLSMFCAFFCRESMSQWSCHVYRTVKVYVKNIDMCMRCFGLPLSHLRLGSHLSKSPFCSSVSWFDKCFSALSIRFDRL